MSRQRVIDTIYFPGQEEIKVYFEVENEIFKARVYDEWIRAENFSELKQKIISTVKEVSANLYKWIPVIQVEETGRGFSRDKVSSGVGFEIERYYVAKKEDGKWLRTDWNIETGNRSSVCQTFKDKGFKVPSVEEDRYGSDDPDRTFYMVHTEEKWAGFMRLIDAIEKLKSKLRDLVGTKEGQNIISEAGNIALRLTYKPEKEKTDDKGKSSERPPEV